MPTGRVRWFQLNRNLALSRWSRDAFLHVSVLKAAGYAGAAQEFDLSDSR
jgi:hypothetical protein